MCGIVGYVGNKENCVRVLIDGLEKLEYRGYDSAGIAFLNNDNIDVVKEKGKIVNLKSKIDLNINSNLGIGHTRWATHGNATKENAHPHKVGAITVVHNGIVENYNELKNYQIQLLNLKEEVLEDNPELEKDLQEVTNSLKQFKKSTLSYI